MIEYSSSKIKLELYWARVELLEYSEQPYFYLTLYDIINYKRHIRNKPKE